MGSIQNIINQQREFNNDRDWSQFHDLKNIALALSIEASELNEIFLWKNAEDADKAKIKEELADVFLYAFLMADKCGLSVEEICLEKLKKNADKYPVEKSKGNSLKYDEL